MKALRRSAGAPVKTIPALRCEKHGERREGDALREPRLSALERTNETSPASSAGLWRNPSGLHPPPNLCDGTNGAVLRCKPLQLRAPNPSKHSRFSTIRNRLGFPLAEQAVPSAPPLTASLSAANCLASARTIELFAEKTSLEPRVRITIGLVWWSD